MKLVALLRDPVRRAYSAWQMYRRIHRKNPSWFLDWVRECDSSRAASFYVRRAPGFGERFEDDIAAELEAGEQGRTIELPILRHGYYEEQLRAWLAHFPREQMYIESNERFSAETLTVLGEIEDFVGVPRHAWDEETVAPVFVGDYERAMSEGAQRMLEELYADRNRRLFELLGRSFPWS
jgi:hypothetical protein